MFRALFRRPRTIRVPVEESGHQIQPVKIIRRAASRPSNFITTFFIAYCVFRFLETSDLLGIDKKSKEAQENIRAHKAARIDSAASDDEGRSKIQKLIEERKTRLEKSKEQSKDGEDGKPSSKEDEDEEESKSLSDAEQLEKLRKMIERHQNAAATEEALTTRITIPIWFRAKPNKLYTPSDQEYKDFVRLQSDEKKVEQLKGLVGQHVLERLQNPIHQINLSYIGFKGTAAVVLELVPQLYPPTSYQVPCLVMKPSGAHYGWRDLPPQLSSRYNTIFRPSVTYKAAKASAVAFFKCAYAITSAKIDQTLGVKLPGHDPRSHIHVHASAVPAKVVARDNSTPSNTNPEAVQQLLRAVHNGFATHERHQDLLSHMPYSAAIQYAGLVFHRMQLKEWASHQQRHTRGVIQIRGVVVCLGETGRYRIEVLAYYLPGDDSFIGPPIINNWYVIKDFAATARLAEKKGKGETPLVSKLLDGQDADSEDGGDDSKTTEK